MTKEIKQSIVVVKALLEASKNRSDYYIENALELMEDLLIVIKENNTLNSYAVAHFIWEMLKAHQTYKSKYNELIVIETSIKYLNSLIDDKQFWCR